MALASKAFAAAGSSIYISAAMPATHDATGFAALTWTEIGNLIDAGSGFGKQTNTTNFEPLAKKEIEQIPTNFTSGSPQITYAYDLDGTDSGQAIMVAAAESEDYHSIKLVLSNGDVVYCKARVMGTPLNVGTVGNLVQYQSTLSIYNEGLGFVRVAA